MWNGYQDFILIEPNTKLATLSKNKQWGVERWQAVVNALPQFRFVQFKQGKYRLEGVEAVASDSPRKAFALLRRATLLLGPDGALHHAAAALNIPAVVVWGGLASPRNLGYDQHVNLHGGSKPCGSKLPCLHCRQELDRITPQMVIDAVRKEHERVTGSRQQTERGDADRTRLAEAAG